MLKHRKQTDFPDITKVKDFETLKDLFKTLNDVFKNIYDDLNGLTPGRSATLPTASIDYLGKFYLRINAGAADTLHICRYNGATLAYEWKTVTVT